MQASPKIGTCSLASFGKIIRPLVKQDPKSALCGPDATLHMFRQIWFHLFLKDSGLGGKQFLTRQRKNPDGSLRRGQEGLSKKGFCLRTLVHVAVAILYYTILYYTILYYSFPYYTIPYFPLPSSPTT